MRTHFSLRSIVRNWRRVALGTGVASVAIASFCWSRSGSTPEALAGQPPQTVRAASETPPPAPAESTSDYGRRAVAYIYGSTPVTREQLGEYLIARYGEERVELFVNSLIIDRVCKEKGIEVTAAEVEADVANTMKGFPTVTRKDFEKQILKPRNLTYFEWKEDVIRPKLLLGKLARQTVRVTEEDLQKAYEAYYGEKVECRLIVWPKEEKHKVRTDIYSKIRDDEKEFDRVAKMQASAELASKAGHIDPIGRNTTGSDKLEQVAFGLRPGELSEVIDTPDGVAVLKCIKHLPPNTAVTLESVRAQLEKEVFERKVVLEVPLLFQQMRKQADPNILLKKRMTEEELKEAAKKNIETTGKPVAKPPQGN